jgi:PAS domain S-box-containing protein
LVQTRTRFHLAINTTKDVIWDWDIKTGNEYFAPRWCEILGYSNDDPELSHTFDSWASRIHPDDYNGVMESVKAHLEEGKPYDIKYRHRYKNGEYRWQQSRGKAVLDNSGQPVRMAGSISDIHEEQVALGKLKESFVWHLIQAPIP